jgi:hypothetical protein
MSAPVVAVSMVKDEADIVGYTVGHLLREVDLVVVEDQGSTDGTLEVLARLWRRSPERLVVLHNPDPVFAQEAHMNALADLARDTGAQWVVPFDADELWYATQGRRLRDVLLGLEADVCVATVWEHVADRYGSPEAVFRLRRPEPWAWPNVCYRPTPATHLWQGQHGVWGAGPRVDHVSVEVRHFPWRSEAQARARVHRNATHQLPPECGQTIQLREWSHQIDTSESTFAGWWWTITDPAGLVVDPAPALPPP